ncbi:MAG: hypothetical protein E6K80_14590 [Candidatus Eisenbacteria bacterium]|uniref:Uncharacterized protein n=1 Tax=Eiseniibacteriota bacterium TaxID=2212470 RepID=A0A538TX68_UNCEI|nr:MAG: hypothetical protein E6K80_14590 [Candidatus Eisenbacteria bacterium]
MKDDVRGFAPTWRAREGRAVRPELWLLAALVVGMLLTEVWQSTRVAELSLTLDQSQAALQQAHARVDFVRAELERRSTRAELAALAKQLRLAPPDVQQVVVLPAEYLASGEASSPVEDRSLASLAERVSRVLVPEAKARGRSGS